MLRATKSGLIAVAMTASVLTVAAGPANAATVDYVVDGDTIRLRSGVYVRLIGIDTPEVGECGYRAAKRKLDHWVGGEAGLVNPAGVDDRDHYGRLIRYVHDSGRDTGAAYLVPTWHQVGVTGCLQHVSRKRLLLDACAHPRRRGRRS